MRALRFGSYSIAATFAGTPSLFAPEVDDAVLLLVAAAAVARRHAAVGVAAAGARLRLGERLLRACRFVISAKSETVWNRRPGLVGLRLRIGIRQLPKISMRSPSARETMARFWSDALAPACRCGGCACACPCG